MHIDSHQHFWTYTPGKNAWLDTQTDVLKRDFLPEDLAPLLKANKIDGCIAVQTDQTEEETDLLLMLTQKHDFIKGVVGWLDLCAPNIADRLAHFREIGPLKGIRHILDAEKDAGFMLRSDFRRGITALGEYGMTFDLLLNPYQLKVADQLLMKFPNQPFVLDHMGKPPIRRCSGIEWREDVTRLAKHTNLRAKLSGFITEADLEHWTYEDLVPYLDFSLNAFGAERLMFGSDWPVCLLAAPYEGVAGYTKRYIETLSPTEQEAIMGGNAISFYGIDTTVAKAGKQKANAAVL